jgi:hypothetical protein
MRVLVFGVSALLLCSPRLDAQQEGRPLSPRDSVSLSLDTTTVGVQYSRPSMRGRKIFGGLVPWDQVWRTGANEATHFRTTSDLLFGGVPVPRGTYTLWTIPRPSGWQVIVNRQTGVWGTRYDPRQDLARLDARAEGTAAAESLFTIVLDRTGPSTGLLRLVWENTVVSVPFERSDRIRPLSPLDSTEARVGGKRVVIRYSRPFKRGRTIWGVIVPFDSLWRTGANAATVLSTEADLQIGGQNVPRGVYTLYSVPTASGCTLVVSTKAPGMPQYDPSMDLVRVPMTMETARTAVDPFTVALEAAGGGLRLRMGWDDRWYGTTVAPKR